jgi:2-polyprenyl-3-methyl-5-hydroxy-6-metoxy-1,4-benzoquinol methylase
MKIKIKAENLFEKIAVIFNLVPKPIIDTQVAFNAARSIIAAADIGLFEALGKSHKSAEQLSAAINTHPAATKNLLDCLVGIGYLRWKNGNYSLRSKYYKWLLNEYSSNLIDKLRFQISEWNWMGQLEGYIQNGKPINIHSSMSKNEWKQYQNGMQSLSINTAKELAGKMPLLPDALQMLDIGGSHGLYSMELCKRNTSLSSTILELPEAIDNACFGTTEDNCKERITYKAGNALTDDLGENMYDLVMINNVVHHFTDDENQLLAKKVAKALKPGGVFGIGELIRQKKPGQGGIAAATAGLYFSLTSSSGTWSLDEIRSWQKEAGLRSFRSFGLWTLPGWKMSIAYK